MSEIDATLIKDGQKVVATVSQSGTIISDPSAVDATALVQTDNGPQLCVKTLEMGEGGGGGTVDQTYDPTSTNAQSGTAVAEAVAPALKNTATVNNALTILGRPTSKTYSINLGYNSYAYERFSVAIGGNAAAEELSVAIGYGATVLSVKKSIQLGQGTNSTANSFQVYSYQMLDGKTGKIPMARLPIVQITQADYDALVSGGTVDANTIYCIIPA